MSANAIKPGTPCQCTTCPEGHKHTFECSDAVRVVTVEKWSDHPTTFGSVKRFESSAQVPMCEPCAAFHEQKGGAK